MVKVTLKAVPEGDPSTVLEIPVDGGPNVRLPLGQAVETTKEVADAAKAVEGYEVSASGAGSN